MNAQNAEIFIFNENNINSAFQEYSPAFHPEGLVFVATNPAVDKEKTEDSKTGMATTSIFISKRDDNNRHNRPIPFAQSLTTTYYDGPLCFNKDGKRVFITRSNLKKGSPLKPKMV
ncbi:MAG: hypothetical protein HC817_00175 [Saprospiraceae bacterium]|nr:hypothetical protein [Saprospiraceae bacterium]